MTQPVPPPAVAAASPTRLYFPVAVEHGPGGYDTLADSAQLAAFCLDVDAQRAQYLTQKRTLGRPPLRLAGLLTEQVVARAEQFVQARVRELPALRAEGTRLEQLGLDALLFELQEDLVIMQLPAGHAPERTRALYMHVSFPGGWDPTLLIGKSFTALHARVPYEAGFERSERAHHASRLFDAPLARYVWSLTAEPTLDRHPKTPRRADFHSTSQLFLRVERQIMVPLALPSELGTASLFFIRTYVYERERLSSEQRAVLTGAIRGMSEATLRYKGMLGFEQRILQLLA
jgi:hypothetical protein